MLIKIRAFGLNRSEWFTRIGDSPLVKFPRILGIECTGEVVEAPGSDLISGEKVTALLGGMGRDYDGSYAEYTSVPREHVFRVNTSLPWEKLTAYSGESSDITEEQLQEYITLVDNGGLNVRSGPKFSFSQLQEAHRLMDANQANGKIVVTT